MLTNLQVCSPVSPVCFPFVSSFAAKKTCQLLASKLSNRTLGMSKLSQDVTLACLLSTCYVNKVWCCLSGVVGLGLARCPRLFSSSAQAPTFRQFRRQISQSFARISPGHHPAHPVSAELFGLSGPVYCSLLRMPTFARLGHCHTSNFRLAPQALLVLS